MKIFKLINNVTFLYVIFLSMFIITTSINAQNTSLKHKSEALGFLEGHWDIENYALENEKWNSIGSTNSIINVEFNGKFVTEKVKYLTKFGEINMITNIGFDNKVKSFKLCAMDKEYGYMDIYFGKWINNDLVFTNLESDEPIQMEDGKELFFRLTYSEINKQGFTHLVEGTYDNGESWFSFSKSRYTRI